MLLSFVLFNVFIVLAPANTWAGDLSAQLPDIGKAGTSVLSPNEEQELGHEFMRSVQGSLKLLDDAPSVAYLQGLADRLAASLQQTHQPISIFLVEDPSINAFAGPGGYIGVHSGLILAAHNEGELVSVLAHEIAHVTQRHLVRAIEANSKMNLPTMGALIAAIVLGANNPQVSEAVLASTVAKSAEQQLTYSRSNEQEADNIGLDMMENAGYDPRSMVAFFETLQNNQRLTDSTAPEFLRTHPLTVGRIADARNRASQFPKQSAHDNATFELIQARIAALTQNSQSIPRDNKTGQQTWSRQAKQYFDALNAAQKGDYAQARELMQRLMNTTSHRLLFPYSAAQIELADNHPERANSILTDALAQSPGNLPLTELYAETLLQLDQAQAALDLLKTTLLKHPDQYQLYQPYAKAATALNKKWEAYQALAEFQYAQGNIHQAVEYLDQALQSPGLSPYDRLTLRARQEMLKTEVIAREQAVSKPDDNHK